MRKQLISFAQVIKFLYNIKLNMKLNSNSPVAYALGSYVIGHSLPMPNDRTTR